MDVSTWLRFAEGLKERIPLHPINMLAARTESEVLFLVPLQSEWLQGGRMPIDDRLFKSIMTSLAGCGNVTRVQQLRKVKTDLDLP